MHPLIGVTRVTVRLVRRTTLLLVVALTVFLAIEVVAFTTAYPDEASRQALEVWARDPGVRMVAGPGSAVSTVGGFVLWDAGLFLILTLAAWALVVTTRVLRGDEASGRADLILAGPVPAIPLLLVQAGVLLTGALVAGVAVGATLAVAGAPVGGSVLVALGMFTYTAVFVGVGALVSQLAAHRRTALGVGALVLAVTLVARIAGTSRESLGWLVWLSPAGWLDHVELYGGNRVVVLAVPFLVTTGLVAVSAALRRLRGTGEGLVPERTRHRSIGWGLGGATAFAWRSHQGTLLAWLAGIALAGAIVGVMMPVIDETLSEDPGYEALLRIMGVNPTDLTRSFIGMLAVILGLIIAAYAVFRIGGARAEEESGRADLLLVRPIRRSTWLLGHLGAAIVAIVLLSIVEAGTTWLSADAAGLSLAADDVLLSVLNVLPAILVFGGIAVLVYGFAPRATVAVGLAAIATAYLIDLVGRALSWPEPILGLSPIHHLAQVPVEAFSWPPAVVLTGVAVLLMSGGVLAFRRRDLMGA